MEGGLETPSPISVIKAGFQELTEHKEPLFGRWNFTFFYKLDPNKSFINFCMMSCFNKKNTGNYIYLKRGECVAYILVT